MRNKGTIAKHPSLISQTLMKDGPAARCCSAMTSLSLGSDHKDYSPSTKRSALVSCTVEDKHRCAPHIPSSSRDAWIFCSYSPGRVQSQSRRSNSQRKSLSRKKQLYKSTPNNQLHRLAEQTVEITTNQITDLIKYILSGLYLGVSCLASKSWLTTSNPGNQGGQPARARGA